MFRVRAPGPTGLRPGLDIRHQQHRQHLRQETQATHSFHIILKHCFYVDVQG